MTRHPHATALVLAALTLVLLTTMVLVSVLDGEAARGRILPGSGLVLTMATISAVGLVVAWHQPRNPIGWLLLAVALCFAATFSAGGYITYRYSQDHAGLPLGPVALLLTPALLAAIPLFSLVIMLFPDGWLPSGLLATRVLALHGTVAVAASTLAAAALFSPLRRRVQRGVDRRFNRARYDADRTLAAFSARLNDAVDLDAVRDDLASAVRAALEPAHVSVWFAGSTSPGERPPGTPRWPHAPLVTPSRAARP